MPTINLTAKYPVTQKKQIIRKTNALVSQKASLSPLKVET